MWTYRAYRFADEAAYAAALVAVGWDHGAPPGVDLMAVGAIYEPPVDEETPGAALPGWHVAAAFRDQAPPAAWDAASITPPEGMPLLGPVPAIGLPDYEAAIDAHVEAVAAAKGYKTAASCAGYFSSTIPAWSAEATAFIAWRDQVWLEVYEALAAVQGGAPAPGVAALVEGLPAMVWPA